MPFNFDPNNVDPRFRQTVYRIRSTPGWITGTAITAALLIVAIPVIALVFTAVATGMLVFLALGGIVAAIAAVRRAYLRLTGQAPEQGADPQKGRKNVIVVRRQEQRDFEDIN